jgi:hypothetical protein
MKDAVMADTIDWELVQSLYLKGLGPSEIQKQTGVKANAVSVRASRYGWRKHLAKASVIVTQHNEKLQGDTEDKGQSNALAKRSALVRERLSDELLRAVDTLTATKPSKSLETQAKRASVMQTLAGAAKPVFGWSEGQSSPMVRINLLSQAVSLTESQPDTRPVIDVTPPQDQS